MSDEQDYKDYQDYLEYQKYVGGAKSKVDAAESIPASMGDVLTKSMAQAQTGKLPGNTPLAIPVPLLAASGDSVLQRVLSGAKTGAMQGAGESMDKPELAQRATSTGIGALIGGAGTAIGEGLSKAGDWAAQKAVGLKDYISGRGTTLTEQGVPGLTKGGMLQNVEKAVSDRGGELENAVGQIKGTVDSHLAANQIDQAGKQFITREGNIPSSVMPEVNSVVARTEDVAARGGVSPSEALDYKRIAQREGWSKGGTARSNLDSDLARREAGGYGKSLSEAYGKQFPGQVNKVEDANQKLSALLDAKRSLDKDPTLIDVLKPILNPAASAGAYAGTYGGKAVSGGAPLVNELLREKKNGQQ
jgi:hypothetical protein